MATMEASLKRWFNEEFRIANPEFLELVRQWRRQVDVKSYSEAAWVLASGVKELVSPSVPINIPTIVITSENDLGSTPDMSVAIASDIENAEMTIVPGLKHLGLIEEPKKFTEAVIDFLKRHNL